MVRSHEGAISLAGTPPADKRPRDPTAGLADVWAVSGMKSQLYFCAAGGSTGVLCAELSDTGFTLSEESAAGRAAFSQLCSEGQS